MDLKAILEASKSKIKNKPPSPARKPVDIAEGDRPYSLPNVIPISPTEQINEINKPTTNRQQTGNKPTTNRQQSGNKLEKKWQQTGNTTGNTTGNITDNKVATNWQQTGNKLATQTIFSALVGLQKKIVIFICQECKNNRSRITEALTLEYIATALKSRTGVIKTTIQRLEKKRYLTRVEFKSGRGGWSRYEVSDHVYHDALRSETDNKSATNWQQTGNKLATEPTTELATSTPSSSSTNKITTTKQELGEEWNFDITPYARWGITHTHLKQLALLNTLSALEVEQSFVEFNYDFDNHALPPIKTNKLNFLMGLLRAGQCYVSDGYRNEMQSAFVEMAKRSEDKRKKLLEEKFLSWEAELTEEERKQIEKTLPTHLLILYRMHGLSHKQIWDWMLNYFMSNPKES